MRETGLRRGGVSDKLLRTVAPQPFSGTVYRFIGSRFLHSPLASAGSRRHGGRFNPPDSFEVLYTALAADTALAEREGILLTDTAIKAARGIRTGILLRIGCRLASVLDLTDEQIRRQLQIPLGELLGPWLPWNVPAPSALPSAVESHSVAAPSQLIGVSVYASQRFEAIVFPSAKDATGRCLAIFPDRLRAGSIVAVDDPQGAITATLGMNRR